MTYPEGYSCPPAPLDWVFGSKLSRVLLWDPSGWMLQVELQTFLDIRVDFTVVVR